MPRGIPNKKAAAPATPIRHACKDSSHIRMVAWLAVAAVAASSGAISYSASAEAVRVDPMASVILKMDSLQAQEDRTEAALARVELELKALKATAASTSTGEAVVKP